jgi:hypothetical protein
VLAIASTIGCAQKDWIDRTLVTENVTGGWAGSFGVHGCYREVRLDLQQDGSKVTGLATFLGSGSTSSFAGAPVSIQGSVAGDVFSFKLPRGTGSGELTVSGDDMSGQFLWGCGPTPMSFHRVDSVSRTGSPPR